MYGFIIRKSIFLLKLDIKPFFLSNFAFNKSASQAVVLANNNTLHAKMKLFAVKKLCNRK